MPTERIRRRKKGAPGPAEPPSCLMVGPLPPPVHGIAVANEAMRRRLEDLGASVQAYDLSPRSLDRSLYVRLRRLRPFVRTALSLHRKRTTEVTALYMSVSGGLGQIYESVLAFIARVKGIPVFLHHHSYAYLSSPTARTRLLLAGAGAHATHIALSADMESRLRSLYGVTGPVVVVSNASLAFDERQRPATRQMTGDAVCLGFLSNISEEKGIFEFIDVLEHCKRERLPIRALIAGPFQDDDTRAAVLGRLQGLDNVAYRGAVYGADKVRFWEEIEVFLFPTKYVNEAEPIVVLEALANGVPVIATRRGSLGSMLNQACGALCDPDDSFVSIALCALTRWREDPDTYRQASVAAAEQFARISACSQAALDKLTREIAFGTRSC